MHDNPVKLTPFRDRTPSLVHQLASGLVNIGLALNHHDRKTAGSNGLGLTQTRILEFLRQCPKRSARLSAIATGLSITPATACESVRTLTPKGLVRKVRSETDERGVILTSSREEKDLVESYKLGVHSYVVKPVDFQKFIDAVKQLGDFWATINEPPPGTVVKARK